MRDLAPYQVSGFINEYTTPAHILSALAPHLFPDSFNRRASPRVALSVTVSLRVDNVIASAVSANVSKGGLQLRTMSPLSVGRRLKVRFRLPAGAAKSKRKRRSPGAMPEAAWASSSIGWIRRRRPSSTSSSIAASSRIERRETRGADWPGSQLQRQLPRHFQPPTPKGRQRSGQGFGVGRWECLNWQWKWSRVGVPPQRVRVKP